MAEMPGMIRPDLQALPQVRDRMTFLYLELAQACGQMLDGTFPRTRGGDPYDKGYADGKEEAFPRIRGGDPHQCWHHDSYACFSPHARG